MSVNKYKRHLYVLPEDDADRQIAQGFVLHPRVVWRQVQVVEPAGGWVRVLDTFEQEYLPLLQQNQKTHVVLLVDFDGDPEARQRRFNDAIPDDLRPRVFVIGPRETPERLRQSLGSGYEHIGRHLADECDDGCVDLWADEQLQHNNDERLRLVKCVKPFLFN